MKAVLIAVLISGSVAAASILPPDADPLTELAQETALSAHLDGKPVYLRGRMEVTAQGTVLFDGRERVQVRLDQSLDLTLDALDGRLVKLGGIYEVAGNKKVLVVKQADAAS